MSKTIKRKITVELPKVKDLSCKKSVFERLGNKKKSNNSVSVSCVTPPLLPIIKFKKKKLISD